MPRTLPPTNPFPPSQPSPQPNPLRNELQDRPPITQASHHALERRCLELEWFTLESEPKTPLIEAKQQLLLAKIVYLDWMKHEEDQLVTNLAEQPEHELPKGDPMNPRTICPTHAGIYKSNRPFTASVNDHLYIDEDNPDAEYYAMDAYPCDKDGNLDPDTATSGVVCRPEDFGPLTKRIEHD